MTNFTLYFSVYGRKTNTFIDIDSNDITRDSIKYAFTIYLNVLHFVIKQLAKGIIISKLSVESLKNLDEVLDNKNMIFSELVIPIVYFLYDQP